MTALMGIVNVTPDSFSDGGQFFQAENAYAQVKYLLRAGATIIDIGGESTRPGAEPVPPEVETQRVVPVIAAAHQDLPDQALSIDSYHVEVAEAALHAGATILNDISGFRDPAMVDLAVHSEADCVLMHMAGQPKTMQKAPSYSDLVPELGDYLLAGAARLEAAGVKPERIILDPGFGFGKTYHHNLELFLKFSQLVKRCRAAGPYRMLVGISRKSFIGSLFGLPDALLRDQASAQLGGALAAAGADIIRVHDVATTHQVLADMAQGTHTAYIALGSNSADAMSQLVAACQALDSLPQSCIDKVATPVLSAPAYDTNQPAFINTVCRLTTRLEALALLTYTQAIEQHLGRIKTRPNGPRCIDIDVLTVGNAQCDLPLFTLPHPRLAERAFVVVPLLELNGAFQLPDGTSLDSAAAPYGGILKTLAPLAWRSRDRAAAEVSV